MRDNFIVGVVSKGLLFGAWGVLLFARCDTQLPVTTDRFGAAIPVRALRLSERLYSAGAVLGYYVWFAACCWLANIAHSVGAVEWHIK